MNHKKYILPVFIPDAGCPFQCVFCNQKKITGMTTKISSDSIRNTIELHLSYFKNKNSHIQIAFFGGSFTGLKIEEQTKLLEIAQDYIKRGIAHSIRISTRPDYINDKVLKFLSNFSVRVIELGVQSLDDKVLFDSKRGHTANDVFKASKLIKFYGFELGHQIMPGLIGDSYKTIYKTLFQSIEMKPSMVRIYPLIVIKDTEIEKLYLEGKYIPLELEEAVEITSFMYNEFKKNNIDVIKMGLMHTDLINFNNSVLAGPFHSAFGELVKSRVFLYEMMNMIEKYDKIYEIEIQVNITDLSCAIGHKKYNKKFLERKYPDLKISIIGKTIKGINIKIIDKGDDIVS